MRQIYLTPQEIEKKRKKIKKMKWWQEEIFG